MNEARFGFNRINITFSPNAPLNPAEFGINNGITQPLALPQITVVGLGLNFGGPAAFPQGRTDTTCVVSDTASYLRGSQPVTNLVLPTAANPPLATPLTFAGPSWTTPPPSRLPRGWRRRRSIRMSAPRGCRRGT